MKMLPESREIYALTKDGLTLVQGWEYGDKFDCVPCIHRSVAPNVYGYYLPERNLVLNNFMGITTATGMWAMLTKYESIAYAHKLAVNWQLCINAAFGECLVINALVANLESDLPEEAA